MADYWLGRRGGRPPTKDCRYLPCPASSRTCKARRAPSNPGAESQQTLARDLHPEACRITAGHNCQPEFVKEGDSTMHFSDSTLRPSGWLRYRRLISGASAAIIAGTLVIAGGVTASASGVAKSTKPSITISVSDAPLSLDPAESVNDGSDQQIFNDLAYEPLIILNSSGDLVPGLVLLGSMLTPRTRSSTLLFALESVLSKTNLS